ILATVAFGSRVTLEDVACEGLEQITAADVAAAREMDMVVRLVGAATLVDGQVDVRVRPALVDRSHPLAAVEGAFNAVMLQGDAAEGQLRAALGEIDSLQETRGKASALPVISDRGVAGLGWN